MMTEGEAGDPGETPTVGDLLADQRRRAQCDEPFLVEGYLSRHPDLLADPEGVLDLIYNEIILRGDRGESPGLSEYRFRFPDLAGPLGDLFEVHAAIEQGGESEEIAPTTAFEGRALAPGPDYPSLEGYEVVGVLGSGGMGVVYRAHDRRRGVDVAVKAMLREGDGSLSRFKQEFRGLLDVSHPNLVSLHELVSDGRAWFIVMEYIDGVDFLDYVRGVPGDHTRLRGATRQLAEGLSALHRAGRLHRDIKPSNVMVTRLGRVVLMDFGLATAATRDGPTGSTDGQVVGTAAYMAPEQAAGLRVSAAGDWYSVGVMIYEALAGRRPFLGQSLQVLKDKQRYEPPPPRDLAPSVPEDLNSLCVDLLRRDPRARPTARETLDRLGAVGDGDDGADSPPVSSSHGGSAPFVGREAHLSTLSAALAELARGQAGVVFVHGRSGAGKSSLVRTFLDGPANRGGAVALAGRCYERESVPYKALDNLMDALARYLRRLPPHEAEALLPRDVGPLARVFPVLRGVGAVVAAPRRAQESPDPQELRRRAYAALRELLARLGDRHPLVLAIDDLQWGDPDSLAILSEVFHPPDSPVLLLIASYRSEEAADNPFLNSLRGLAEAAALTRRDIAVGPLPFAEARALARHLMGPTATDADQRAEAVARESGGNPFFVTELARSTLAEGPHAGAEGEGTGSPTLDGVLWRRILRLPEAERRLLEVVSVSGGPLRPDVAWQCLGGPGDERSALALLRAARLLRGTGGPADGERVETYHDRVRETVVAHLGSGELRDWHGRLARALELGGGADPETLGDHFRGAGDGTRAGENYALAAGQAAGALAFERASSLYRLALELLPPGAGRRGLREGLAAALANAGRGAEAAQAYLDACDGATVAEALEHRRRAAMQFLISGHIDEGLEALRDVLAAIGLTLPVSPKRALASLLWNRGRIRLRGLRFRPRDTSEVAAADLSRVDVCWSVGVGLSNVDWIRGADFQARGLLLALRAGEPYRVARALTVEAAHAATAGRGAAGRTSRLLERADALSRGSDEPYAAGMVELARGVSAYLEARWGDARAACDRAEAVFRDRCTGVAWELDTAHAYAMWALSHLGDWAELARRFPLLIAEARERGDLYAEMNLSTYILSVVRLAADEPEAARDELARVIGQWSGKGYHVQHNDQFWAMTQVELYLDDGPAAWARLTRYWPTLERSLLMRVQFIRVAMWGLRGRCALAAEADPREADRAASRLGREGLPWADAQARTIRAGLAAREGRQGDAADLLDRAGADFRDCDMPMCAAVAQFRRGGLLGGTEGEKLVALAETTMAARSVVRPDRVAAMYAPGFRRG